MLSAVLRAGRWLTAGFSCLSTTDSILMSSRYSPPRFCLSTRGRVIPYKYRKALLSEPVSYRMSRVVYTKRFFSCLTKLLKKNGQHTFLCTCTSSGKQVLSVRSCGIQAVKSHGGSKQERRMHMRTGLWSGVVGGHWGAAVGWTSRGTTISRRPAGVPGQPANLHVPPGDMSNSPGGLSGRAYRHLPW